ncbi:hypothetical protein BOX15_Mlig003291g2 [Macrostomum lignano]|uniref:Phosphoinositide phospholipase C n=1 Tax=Macrostomum lignano TaxID=282301 RepID=A0A267ENP6_9PLAT|nr:hypothetical protein BOX15_Mlig003291g2 [Macrostomum lignano]
MASAKTGVHSSQLRPVTVPNQMLDGAKFLRWEDESSIPQTVTLKIDSKGYLLYWQTANGDVDFLDTSFIRDTRCGRSARLPKDLKLREICNLFGSGNEPLESRSLSVIVGSDLVNLQWVNFVASDKETAQQWAQEMFLCATNILSMNPSFSDLLERAWTKLIVCRDCDDRIPVKSLHRLIAAHKEDKKRVEAALSDCKLLSPKSEFINAKVLTFDAFVKFFTSLCPRQDVDQICHEINPANSKAKQQPVLNIAQFVQLLNEKQRDPRLNEILYPYANEAKAKELIQKYEPSPAIAAKDQLSSAGLQAFLMSPDNGLIPRDKLDISQDMEQPLSHYFINSSHNTYLAGHQLTGKSSVEMYRQVLLTGCRCVELDCWDGKGADEEPMVTHGFTMCSEVSFRETMEAIAETAFKVSDFPVILSFENHCSPKQQAKMVKLIKDYLGDRILAQPLESHPLKPGTPLPSPELLKGKFLIKNKKRDFKKSAKQHGSGAIAGEEKLIEPDSAVAEGSPVANKDLKETEAPNEASTSAVDVDEDPDEEDPELRRLRETAVEMSTKEPETVSEISAMVNYMEPAPFYSFEYAAKKNVAYECCSISENSATNLLKEAPEDFVK